MAQPTALPIAFEMDQRERVARRPFSHNGSPFTKPDELVRDSPNLAPGDLLLRTATRATASIVAGQVTAIVPSRKHRPASQEGRRNQGPRSQTAIAHTKRLPVTLHLHHELPRAPASCP